MFRIELICGDRRAQLVSRAGHWLRLQSGKGTVLGAVMLLACLPGMMEAQQWTTNADGSLSPAAGATVGIGTATPDGLFQVNGLFHVSGSDVYIGTHSEPSSTNRLNTFVGYHAGAANTTGYFNTGIGFNAMPLNTTGHSNTAVGRASLPANTTGYGNTAMGTAASLFNTDGSTNVAIGYGTLFSNIHGQGNVGVGSSALVSVIDGNWNTALGTDAGVLTNGWGNVFLGYGAGYSATGSNKLYISNGHLDSNVLIYGDFAAGKLGVGTLAPSSALSVKGVVGSDLFDVSSSTTSSLFKISEAGNVGIGAGPQTGYRLAVKGTVGAGEVIVTNTSGWADYVFAPGYAMAPLSEVASYIESNHHLPGIPSEAEVAEKGVGLGDMQARLLAKVEELTLHLIEADKRIGELESENRKSRSRR